MGSRRAGALRRNLPGWRLSARRPGAARWGRCAGLFWTRERWRPARRRRFWRYATPLGLLALIGLGLARRRLPVRQPRPADLVVALIAVGSVLPVAISAAAAAAGLAARLPDAVPRRDRTPARRALAVEHRCRSSASCSCCGRLAVTAGLRRSPPGPPSSAWCPVFLFAAGRQRLGRRGPAGGDRARSATSCPGGAAPGELLAEQAGAHRAGAGPAGGAGGTRPDRPRDARRGRPPHVDDRGAGRDRARTGWPTCPEPARAELATIATAARAALTDMRRLLGVLRCGDRRGAAAPQPGLADLAELVATARRGPGVTVDAAEADRR